MFGGKGKTNKSIVRLETLMQECTGKAKEKENRRAEKRNETKTLKRYINIENINN